MISALYLRLAARFAIVLIAVSAVCRAEDEDAKWPASVSTAAVADSRIIPPSSNYAFPNVEYVYSVQWGILHAGTSTVKLQRSPAGVRVAATADSAGMPDKFFKVHDLFDADVNPRTFCTSLITKQNQEGSRRRDYNIVLDYQHGKSRLDIKDLKTSETKHAESDIPNCVTDVITGFFYVASLPLAPGYSEVFPVNDNGRMTHAKLNVEGREHIKNPAGEFETLRVKVEPIAGAMKGKGTLWVWFTDDARHAPVQMKSKLGFATFTFQLQKIDTPRQGNTMGR
jgi:hypothetical protein